MPHPSGVTDHAVLRFLERVYCLNIEQVRAEICALPGLAAARKMGATSFSSSGVTFRIVDGNVITIIENDSPSAGRIGSANAHGRRVAVRAPSKAESGRLLRRDARRFK